MSATRDKLSPRDEQIAALIASGRTQLEAATDLGISKPTVARTVAKPTVAARVRAIRLTAAASAAGVLADRARLAAVELARIASEGGTRADAVRVRACTALLGLAFNGVAVLDLQADIDALKAQLDAASDPGRLPGVPKIDAPATEPQPTTEQQALCVTDFLG